jgi:hypothetical protein
MRRLSGGLAYFAAAAVLVCAAACAYGGTVEVVQNGSFESGLTGWTVARDVSAWPVLQSDGANSYVSLHPSMGFRGPLLWQSLNVTGISGATVKVSMGLTWMYDSMTCGQSIAVYLDYVTTAGETRSLKVINPKDCEISYYGNPVLADVTLPGDAAKLTKVCIARVDQWGQAFGDNVSVLVPDTATVGSVPRITSISSTSGAYGDTLTINGFRRQHLRPGQGHHWRQQRGNDSELDGQPGGCDPRSPCQFGPGHGHRGWRREQRRLRLHCQFAKLHDQGSVGAGAGYSRPEYRIPDRGQLQQRLHDQRHRLRPGWACLRALKLLADAGYRSRRNAADHRLRRSVPRRLHLDLDGYGRGRRDGYRHGEACGSPSRQYRVLRLR